MNNKVLFKERGLISAISFLFCLGILFTALSAVAAEYFVNKQGNDSNDGLSRDKAFLTVQKGLDAIAPGNMLTISPGEYFGSATRKDLGQTNKETLIRAEIRGTAILRGDIPMPAPRAVDGYKFVYAFTLTNKVQCVNEVDTLTMNSIMPSINELEFNPGSYYYDEGAGTVYFSTSDWQAPEKHRLTVSVIDNSGFLLSNPTNVTIDGIAARGFNKDRQERKEGQLYGSRVGIGIAGGANVIIRYCTTFLNGTGIAVETSKNCLIEHCASYGNYSKFGATSGNICNWNTPEEGGIIRHCKAFASHLNGIDFYGNIKGLCRLEDNITWMNNCDMKIKGGRDADGIMERCVAAAFFPEYTTNIYHSLCTLQKSKNPDESNIIFADTPGLEPGIEFADPDNLDYRLQSTSRFRNAANGQDKGLYPYAPNIFYVKTNGSDSADGLSVTNAWQSLEKAAAKLRPGDTLSILSGEYAANLKIDADGSPGKPITIGGRGNDRVVINGLVEIKKSAHLALERLNFIGGGLNIKGGDNIKVSNCGFNTPLGAAGLTGFTIEHCALTRGIELKACKNVLVRDNIFDNANIPALTLEGPLDGCIAWNSFSRAEGCRLTKAGMEPGGKSGSTDGKITGIDAELYSSVHSPEFTTPEKGVFTLRNDHLFNGYGSLGMPLGPYRRVRVANGLRIVDLTVFAVSATTADIEWRTTGASTTELQWGDTPACTNNKELIYWPDTFHTMSLTGLKPAKKYYFRVVATMPGYELHGNPEAEALDLKLSRVKVSSEVGELTTLEKNPGPATYYVGTNGNDTSSGLSARESWRTVSFAARRAGPGDTVLIGGGKYQETVRVRRSGDRDAPIRFTCAPGEKVWLDGRNLALFQGMNIFGKDYVHVDGLYFHAYGTGGGAPLSGGMNINGGSSIQITRCFYDGRSPGYTPNFINAASSSNLLVQNCFMTRGFSGPHFWYCPGLRVENNVFFINQIGLILLLGKTNDYFSFKNNVIVDNIIGKSMQPLLLINDPKQMLEGENCFYLRNPEKERGLIRMGMNAGIPWDNFKKLSGNPSTAIFTNPQFPALKELVTYANAAGLEKIVVSKSRELAAEHAPGKAWDFNDFFAANPELVKRGIGLQPEAFKDFQFNSPSTNNAVAH